MKFKRDLIIVALATFCLTATIFMVIPTRSSPGDYDPWIDNNEDGAIDIFDAIGLANAFATSGDPTKNVNVMNWPATSQITVFSSFQTTDTQSEWFNASGFAQMHLLWKVALLTDPENVTIDIYGRVFPFSGGHTPILDRSIIVTPVKNLEGTMTIQVPSESFRFSLSLAPGTTANVCLAFYLTYA